MALLPLKAPYCSQFVTEKGIYKSVSFRPSFFFFSPHLLLFSFFSQIFFDARRFARERGKNRDIIFLKHLIFSASNEFDLRRAALLGGEGGAIKLAEKEKENK